MKPIRIALTKGKIEKEAVKLFDKMGLDTSGLGKQSRKLIIGMSGMEVLLTKPADVITYIERGVCDIGIVGKDTIMECGSSFYEVIDLGFGKCRFALAAPKNTVFYDGFGEKTIATKYPNVAGQFCLSKAMDAQIIKIDGSVELAPIIGLSDGIVDIVETGKTLFENGLEIVEEIAPISARVIVNIASMKMNKREIESFLNRVQKALDDEQTVSNKFNLRKKYE